jgi:hypothetical protein
VVTLRYLTTFFALSVASAVLPLGAASDALENVLARMDRSAAIFKSVSADVRWVEHTAVINDDAVDTGSMKLKRSKHDIRALVEFMEPDRKSVSLHENKLSAHDENYLELSHFRERRAACWRSFAELPFRRVPMIRATEHVHRVTLLGGFRGVELPGAGDAS